MADVNKILETEEAKRLRESRGNTSNWRLWGPYLSERQWGTVREDYSPYGNAWEYFPHDHARSRAYRWGEDGIAGICDSSQCLCFAIGLWNGNDPIIKERLFGLTGNEGNHGEDVKEYYFYLANTPSHSYMKYLYKYPQASYPFSLLVNENIRRRDYPGRGGMEFELLDTGVFDDNRYFDVYVEYAKNSPEDILIKISVVNRGPDTRTVYLLPALWFRNTWSWGHPGEQKPLIKLISSDLRLSVIEANHNKLGKRWFYCENPNELLFTENETNMKILDQPNKSPYVKDGINNYIAGGIRDAVNPNKTGTKASASYILEIKPSDTKTIRLRLSDVENMSSPFDDNFETLFIKRENEMNEFYDSISPLDMSDELRSIQRQAFYGMLWSKQFYYYVVEQWLQGDPAGPPPPPERKNGRNREWIHLHSEDILSMPDKWEYPWFAAWDLAFHTIPLAMIDPDFAKQQLYLFTREWYMHPNGQIPAYEWAFGDVNPPVAAWAAWRVYKIEGKYYGHKDVDFLKRIFTKLLLYFTWWVNRKDAFGNNVFEGGFLGLDNVSMFDRSNHGIPNTIIEQSDGTAWMGMYCLNMLKIASELSRFDSMYREWCGKFLQHFFYIADAMNHIGGDAVNLWDDNDKFYYDVLRLPDRMVSLKVRSIVGIIPLFAVETIDLESLFGNMEPDFADTSDFPDLRSQLDWYIKNRPDLAYHENISIRGIGSENVKDPKGVLLSFVDTNKLRYILEKMLDENEFLSPYGVRSLSKYHENHPVSINVKGQDYSIRYEPAESTTGMFGGNSNWRGPVWFPINYLIIESLQKFHYYLGDDFRVECPKGSGKMMTLWEVSLELSKRLIDIFIKDPNLNGNRPVYGGTQKFQKDPHWNQLILFYEYFHGDNGAGIGASHQTGWTGLIAKLIHQYMEYNTR
ncbi:MAG: MGH1-like glycoside hydrolase domain-containing protein [Bacillota bacterium]